MEKIRCVIAGLGRIASLLEDDKLREKPASHAGAIISNPDTELVGGADPDPERQEAFGRRWKVKDLFSDPEKMCMTLRPDILHICTDPSTHLQILQAGLRAKVPLILCEKPLASNIGDARKMINLMQGKHSQLMVNHERRYSLDYVHAREIISSRRYGALRSIHGSLFMGKNRAPGQILLDDGTHMIDIIRFLSDCDISHVQSLGDFERKGGTIFIEMVCNEIPIFMEVAGGRDYVLFELDFSFETGRIRIGNGLFEEFSSEPSPYYENMRSLKQIDISFQKTEYFKRMLEDAVKVVRSGSRPISDGMDALAVMEVINEINHSIRGFGS